MTSTSNWPIKAELIAELPESVGNITFTPAGDIIYSHHPLFDPKISVAQLNEEKTGYTPFPNEEWNIAKGNSDHYLDSVLGLRGDGMGVIWMLDMGTRGGITPKLVGWNTTTDCLERIYYIPPPATLMSSQLTNFTIDEIRGQIIIADEGVGPGGDGTTAALVVIDMKTGIIRRLLQGHESCLPEEVSVNLDGRELTVEGGAPLRIGADGLVADLDFSWLFFGPLSGGWIYCVRLEDISNKDLSAEELSARVERYARKPNSGGLAIDREGNLYLTSVETTAVGVIPADTKTYSEFASHENLNWPHGVSYAPDGYIYVSAAQVSEAAAFNQGEVRNKPPYRIFRFRPLSPGRLGY